MNDEEFKTIALVIIGLMAVVAIYPIVAANRNPFEPFSEIGILGPNKKLGDYPSVIGVGQKINLYIYVGNHEGKVGFYRVLAKLGNQNSTISNSIALEEPIIASWDVILPNEKNNTIPINLSLTKVGLKQRLIFELYMYDSNVRSFLYHQRWTQLWLDVYGQGG
jgi:uncharacterized membrane protein